MTRSSSGHGLIYRKEAPFLLVETHQMAEGLIGNDESLVRNVHPDSC